MDILIPAIIIAVIVVLVLWFIFGVILPDDFFWDE